MLGSYLPDSYIQEPRLRIDAYRRLAGISTIEEAAEYEEELVDRFGALPNEVLSLLQETRIRCLAEQAEFDLVETEDSELKLRFAKRGKGGEQSYLRNLGRLPKLKKKDPLLKLNEIVQFLKIYIYGKEN